MNKDTQHAKIIKMLRASPFGVPNYKFPQYGMLSYTKRISELRADGYNITMERQYLSNGRATGVFIYSLNEEDNETIEIR